MATIGVLFKDVKNKISYIHTYIILLCCKINFTLRYQILNPVIMHSCRTSWAHEEKSSPADFVTHW